MISFAHQAMLILILTLSQKCQCYCPQPFKTYNESSCFYVNYAKKYVFDFETAEYQCSLLEFPKINSHLASFDDVDQERWVVNNLVSSNMLAGETREWIWIGLKRSGSHFYWLDGNPSEFRNWESNEPNNGKGTGTSEDCVEIRTPYVNDVDNRNNRELLTTLITPINFVPENWIHLLVTLVVIFAVIIFGILARWLFLRIFNWRRENVLSTNANNANVLLADLEMSTLSRQKGNLNPNYADWLDSIKSRVPVYPPQQLTVLKELGEGAFGRVYLTEHLPNNEEKINDEHAGTQNYYTNLPSTRDKHIFAMKVLKNISGEKLEDLEREMKILSALNHPNIVKFFGIAFKCGTLALLFECLENGDLVNYLRNNSVNNNQCQMPLTCNDLLTISCQIARGLDYLASQHLVHRDLAGRNCLVGDKMLVKISDFGMTRDIYVTDYYKMGPHTLVPLRWLPPESLLYRKFTIESDVWSFGILLWEIFSYGNVPWYMHSNSEVLQIIQGGKLLQQPYACPSEIYSLMLGCWAKFPNERLTANQLLTKLGLILDNKRRYCNAQESEC